MLDCRARLLFLLCLLAPSSGQAQAPVYAFSWGSLESGPNQFRSPVGVATDGAGIVYVADTDLGRVKTFTRTGTYLSEWPAPFVKGVAVDTDETVFVALSGTISRHSKAGFQIAKWTALCTSIAVDADHNVYANVWGGHQIQKFTNTGTLITQWGSLGSAPGQFKSPIGIAVDNLGGIYVADKNNLRIQYFAFSVSPTRAVSWGALKGRYR